MTTRRSVLDELGNKDAEPGSKDWAVGVLRDIQSTLNDINGDAAHLKVMVGLFREHKGYRLLTNGRNRPFGLWDQFVSEPQPHGLGVDPDDLDQTIKERTARQAQELAEEAEDDPIMKPQEKGKLGGRGNKKDSTQDTSFSRTSSSHLARRIAAERPDILKRMKAGEFPSVKAAAREAGIIQPSFECPADPVKAAARLRKRFTGEALEILLRELTKKDQ